MIKLFNRARGFTILELLVVVAIIALLSAVVLALSSNARKKGQDGAIKSEMVSLRSQAELYAADNNNSFNNLFTSNNTWASGDTKVQALLTGINNKTTVHTAGSGTNAWAAQAQLKLDPTQYLCVNSSDSKVYIGTTAMGAGATVCP